MILDKKYYLVVSSDCPHCEPMKQRLGSRDDVGVKNVDTEDGAEFLYKCKADGAIFYAVPTCLINNDGKLRICSEIEKKQLLEQPTTP